MWSILGRRHICVYTALRNHYETLGVSRDATAEQLKEAFMNKSKLFHPDIAAQDGRNTHEEFVALNEAFSILNKPRTRRLYDAGLPTSATIHSSSGGGKGTTAGTKIFNPYRSADYKNPYLEYNDAWQSADRWTDYTNSYGTSRAKRRMEKELDSEFWTDHWEFSREFGGGGPQIAQHGKNNKLKTIRIQVAFIITVLIIVPVFLVATFVYTPSDEEHPVAVVERMFQNYLKFKMSHDEVE